MIDNSHLDFLLPSKNTNGKEGNNQTSEDKKDHLKELNHQAV